MLVYLATPIDQSRPGMATYDPAPLIKKMLDRIGAVTFTPGSAFSVDKPGTSDALTIDAINSISLNMADALVAILPAGVPTLGVPAEIQASLAANRPTVVFTNIEHSVQLAAWRNRGATVLVSEFGDSGACPSPGLLRRLLSQIPDQARFEGDLASSTGVYGLAEEIDHRHQWEPNLLVTRTSDSAKVPARAHQDDAGFDLAVVGEHEIHPGSYARLPTGLATAIPPGHWGLIIGRSSSWTKWEFDIRLGVIDAGFRGELMVGVHNRGAKTRIIQPGTRLAQYVVLPSFPGGVVEINTLPPSARGENGWGSSGQ